MNQTAKATTFRILPYFSLLSFLCIILTAAFLIGFYRQIMVGAIVELGEQNNVALARTALTSVRSQLVGYLMSAAAGNGETVESNPELNQAIKGLMADTTVVRIKLYDRNGTVVFSTKREQIGNSGTTNQGFLAAMTGKTASKLIYRDTFNRFDQATEEDNLIQTYIPVRRARTAPIQGVFEIYTDVNALVSRAERTEILIFLGAGITLLLLYGLLVLVVRRASHVIANQQHVIQERTQTLELLSAQEDEKKRIAGELHEGIAQTLSAIKLHLENVSRASAEDKAGVQQEALEALVGVTQDAIEDVRRMAVNLRPSGIEDFGVLATLNAYCRELQARFPGLHPEVETRLQEDDIPEPLKINIYRIAQNVLYGTARDARTTRVLVELWKADGRIWLAMEDRDVAKQPVTASSWMEGESALDREGMRERAVLSGGSFDIEGNEVGGLTRRVSWPC